MRDPICGKPVEASTPWFIERDGTRLLFCSLACALRFNGMPGHDLPYLAGESDGRAPDVPPAAPKS